MVRPGGMAGVGLVGAKPPCPLYSGGRAAAAGWERTKGGKLSNTIIRNNYVIYFLKQIIIIVTTVDVALDIA